MRNRTHQAIGASLGVATGMLIDASVPEVALMASGAAVGSWLPDIDQPGARIHRRTALERRSLLATVAALPPRAAMLVPALLLRHRGPSHSLVVIAAAAGVAFVLLPLHAVTTGVAIGCAAHVVADGDAELLWPFYRRRVNTLNALRRAGMAAKRTL
jgi:membrane-bound metal-dependent hydrolase YbcI (DUF457 family)